MTDAVTNAVANTGTTASNAANITAGQSSLNESYSTFLTLLTTQLKNQDPTSPLDTNAFTQQLVSMTGVQQQLLTNQLLQTMATNSSAGGGVAGAVGLIGKTVTATSSSAALSGGSASWTYTLPSTASAATATISDSTGKAVYSAPLTALTAGAHTLSWNGKDYSGVQLADGGTYTISIAAADSSGNAITATNALTGTVGSVTQSNGTTMVKIGATAVPLSSVTSVTSQ